MPRLSDSMEEGTITAWLKADGERVERGEELATIETDKAEMAFEADAPGVLRILVAAGEAVPVGAPIALLEDGEPAPPRDARGGRGVSASPLARRLASSLGVELAAVAGSGPRGRIFKADVIAAAGSRAPAPREEPAAPPSSAAAEVVGETSRVELSRLQRTVARRMSESKATAPDFAVSVDVDMGELLGLRRQLKELLDPVPTVTDAIVRAAALTLSAHPRANAAYRDGALELRERVNVGVAVAAEEALLVPVVSDADRRPLTEIAAITRRLVERARGGELTPPELAAGTFTVSNLGMFDVDSFAGILNPPQAAILCVGATRQRPAVGVDGIIEARPLATFTLVSDHRVLYGADAASFLGDLRQALESPLRLLL